MKHYSILTIALMLSLTGCHSRRVGPLFHFETIRAFDLLYGVSSWVCARVHQQICSPDAIDLLREMWSGLKRSAGAPLAQI